MLASLLAAPVSAAPGDPTEPYVVQSGDTLDGIARQFCTTLQEITDLNSAALGADPVALAPGTELTVTRRCGSPSATPYGSCDRGPTIHAHGWLDGNIYTIARRDTMYSISKRFCLTVSELSAANRVIDPWRIYAGQRLVISGDHHTWPPSPPPPPVSAFLTITSPTTGSVLAMTFTASGTGGGLNGSQVVVRARDGSGHVLAEQTTTLQVAGGSTSGRGTRSTARSVDVSAGTTGSVVALAPGSGAQAAAVQVTFGSVSSDYEDYAPGACRIRGKAGSPFYAYPGGPEVGHFASAAVLKATRGAKVDGAYWYQVDPGSGAVNPPYWVPATSTSASDPGCVF
jgi:LysM repeat protein